MINLSKISKAQPYKVYKSYYDKALKKKEPNIEAISISSYDPRSFEVNSRYVNLKYINKDEWIFFSNYESVKADEFHLHNQISVNSFWPSINVQIRIKANIYKSKKSLTKKHFYLRARKKNALAISSNQSNKIDSYEEIVKNYKDILKNNNDLKLPDHWGGYSFTPYYFEFWEGHESRINKRLVYVKNAKKCENFIIQP